MKILSNLERAELCIQDDQKRINPAFDYLDNIVYLSHPVTVEHSEYDKDLKKEIIRKERFQGVITSNKDLIVLDKKTLKDMEIAGIKLKSIPISLEKIDQETINRILINNNVSLHEAFNLIREQYEKYMEFSDIREYDLISVWVLGTYFYPLFDSYGLMYLNAVKRAGKTKCLTLTSELAFNGQLIIQATTSSAFRLVEGTKGTLCLDEMERISSKFETELRTVLLQGYKKGAFVPRTEEKLTGKGFTVQGYDIYSPKIFASIKWIDDVLVDRVIPIILLRGADKKKMNLEIKTNDNIFRNIRNKLYECIFTNHDIINKSYNDPYFLTNKTGLIDKLIDVEEEQDIELHSRLFELWKPLLTLSKLISEDVYNNLYSLALNHMKGMDDDDSMESKESLIIGILLSLVKEEKTYSMKEIEEYVQRIDHKMNAHTIGWVFRRLKLMQYRKKGKPARYDFTPGIVQNIADRMRVEPIEIDLLKERINHKDYAIKIIDQLSENNNMFNENELIESLEKEMGTKANYIVEQLKQGGYLMAPMPGFLKKV